MISMRFCMATVSRVSQGLRDERLLGVGRPMAGLELGQREPDQRITVTEVVVQEGEGVILGQRGEPERELGQVDGHPVLVHSVKAALGDEPAGEQKRRLVAGDSRGRITAGPGLAQQAGEQAHGFDQERSRAHGRIADLEREDRILVLGWARDVQESA